MKIRLLLIVVISSLLTAVITFAGESSGAKIYGYVTSVTDISTKKIVISLARGEVMTGDVFNVFNSNYEKVTKITVGRTLKDSSYSVELPEEVYNKIKFAWIVSNATEISKKARVKLTELKRTLIRQEKLGRKQYRIEEKKEARKWREIEKHKTLRRMRVGRPPAKRPVVIIDK